MGRTFCGLCPKNEAANFESGHNATFLSKIAWPLVQISLILCVVSFSSANWRDGYSSDPAVKDRVYAGAWRACMSGQYNTSHHPDTLPVDICTDTAAFIVDALKTHWVAAWRSFLILSFIFLTITSGLMTLYMFGGRQLEHSTFPLFFSFASGFASAIFGGLSLIVFYVKSGKARELQNVPIGWAAGVNLGAVITMSYTSFLILGEFMEINDFRSKRKRWRQAQHATLSAENTFPPGGSSGHVNESEATATHAEPQRVNHALSTDHIQNNASQAQDGNGQVQSRGIGKELIHSGGDKSIAVPSMASMFQSSDQNKSVPQNVERQAQTNAEPSAEQEANMSSNVTSMFQTSSVSNNVNRKQVILKPEVKRETSSEDHEKGKMESPKQNNGEEGALTEDEAAEDRFRFRHVTLRRNRRISRVADN